MLIITDGFNIDITTFISFVVILLLTLYILSLDRRKNLPPGPINLPVVGYAPFAIGKNNEKGFLQLSKKYGDVVYFRIGAASVVTLNTYDAIKEGLMLNPEIAVTRPIDFNALKYIFNDTGHFVDNGKIWKDHRRFTISALRDLGNGKENLESQIHEEAMIVVDEIQKHCGQQFDPGLLLLEASTNTISALAFGVRYEHSDPEFEELLKIVKDIDSNVDPLHNLTIFPYLRFTTPDCVSGIGKLKDIREHIKKFAEMKIQAHETPENNFRDYTEMYLKKQNNDYATGKQNTSFNRDRLKSNILGLCAAGANTTGQSMRWILKMLIKYTQIQKELQEELDAVIGTERVPKYSDRFNMPQTEAFLSEILRFSSLVPYALSHATHVGTKIFGYDIPAGATIIPMLFMANKDPNIWGDPENFRPERFLDAQGKLRKIDSIIAFGMGKRACPGENFAKTTMFIFLTSLLQHFTFSAPPNEEADIEIVTTNAVSRHIMPFKIIARQRR